MDSFYPSFSFSPSPSAFLAFLFFPSLVFFFKYRICGTAVSMFPARIRYTEWNISRRRFQIKCFESERLFETMFIYFVRTTSIAAAVRSLIKFPIDFAFRCHFPRRSSPYFSLVSCEKFPSHYHLFSVSWKRVSRRGNYLRSFPSLIITRTNYPVEYARTCVLRRVHLVSRDRKFFVRISDALRIIENFS